MQKLLGFAIPHTKQAKFNPYQISHCFFFSWLRLGFVVPGEKGLLSHHLISWLTRFPLNAHFYFKTEEDWSCVHFLPSDFILALFEKCTQLNTWAWFYLCALDIFILPTPFLTGRKRTHRAGGADSILRRLPDFCAHCSVLDRSCRAKPSRFCSHRFCTYPFPCEADKGFLVMIWLSINHR